MLITTHEYFVNRKLDAHLEVMKGIRARVTSSAMCVCLMPKKLQKL
jgi:hypothetical protein